MENENGKENFVMKTPSKNRNLSNERKGTLLNFGKLQASPAAQSGSINFYTNMM
jgi:hypothetical protein